MIVGRDAKYATKKHKPSVTGSGKIVLKGKKGMRETLRLIATCTTDHHDCDQA